MSVKYIPHTLCIWLAEMSTDGVEGVSDIFDLIAEFNKNGNEVNVVMESVPFSVLKKEDATMAIGVSVKGEGKRFFV